MTNQDECDEKSPLAHVFDELRPILSAHQKQEDSKEECGHPVTKQYMLLSCEDTDQWKIVTEYQLCLICGTNPKEE